MVQMTPSVWPLFSERSNTPCPVGELVISSQEHLPPTPAHQGALQRGGNQEGLIYMMALNPEVSLHLYV